MSAARLVDMDTDSLVLLVLHLRRQLADLRNFVRPVGHDQVTRIQDRFVGEDQPIRPGNFFC
jgi:hypothetical protein